MTENTAATSPVIALELGATEVNIVLNALAQLPFKNVDQVITDVKTQAESQLDPMGKIADDQTMSIKLKLEDVNLCLGALSELPYNVSAGLINKIKSQGEAQLAAFVPANDEAPVEKVIAEA